MKIHEYQAMDLFDLYGIETLPHACAESADEAGEKADELDGRVVVKAQVLVGGRGKAGGIKVAASPDEAKAHARHILSMQIKSIPVEKVLIVRAAVIKKEFYLGITIDRNRKEIVLIASASGGVDIEELAKEKPDAVRTIGVNPATGLDKARVKDFLRSVFGTPLYAQAATGIVERMFLLFREKDCSLVEINPLALIEGDKLVALDAKINFDDNAVGKHPDIEKLRNVEEYTSEECTARQVGLSYVHMDGSIGCMVNGAGLAMATMDIIKLFGGEPANFLDVGGSSNPQKVLDAYKIILSNKNVKAILINIFGGITRCDDIAQGIILATEKMKIPVPLVIRLIGTNEKSARVMLTKKGFIVSEYMTDAIKKVVELSKERT